ncbi:MAG: hypothetical protein IPL96_11165 [Holophagaceae bacterium]|nr:hypothetical protein [Holophagaceae bacterium]
MRRRRPSGPPNGELPNPKAAKATSNAPSLVGIPDKTTVECGDLVPLRYRGIVPSLVEIKPPGAREEDPWLPGEYVLVPDRPGPCVIRLRRKDFPQATGTLTLDVVPDRGGGIYGLDVEQKPTTDYQAIALADGTALVVGLRFGKYVNRNPLAARIVDTVSGAVTDVSLPSASHVGGAVCQLPDGRVLLAGGGNPGLGAYYAPDLVEFFDPQTRSFTAAPLRLPAPLKEGSGTVLSDGSVLLQDAGTGGRWRYDPMTGLATALALPLPRGCPFPLVPLPDGGFLFHGRDGSEDVAGILSAKLTSPRILCRLPKDQLGTPLAVSRKGEVLFKSGWGRQAKLGLVGANGFREIMPIGLGASGGFVALADGRILTVGHRSRWPEQGDQVFLRYIDLKLGKLLDGPDLPEDLPLLPLQDGRVLLGTSLIFDPTMGTMKPSHWMGEHQGSRSGHRLTAAGQGELWFTGGINERLGPSRQALRYDPVSHAFEAASALAESRAGHTATRLRDGRLLIAGGGDGMQSHASAEILDPATRSFMPCASLRQPREGHSATLLPDGSVLIVGGSPGVEAERYSPSRNAFVRAGGILEARTAHAAALTPTGAMVVGGRSGSKALAMTLVFDPRSNTFSRARDLPSPRWDLTATPLRDGLVLVAGGADGTRSARSDAELFDPATGSYLPLPPMRDPRAGHAAVLLQDGRVMLIGGRSSMGRPLRSTEFFDPGLRRFLPGPALLQSRAAPAAALLPSGGVVIAGGDEDGLGCSVERFRPAALSASTLTAK